MIENSDRVPPSVEDIAGWADQYGLSHPVLIDGGGSITSKFLNGDPNFTGSYGLPSMHLLDKGMVVDVVNDWVSASQVEALLD